MRPDQFRPSEAALGLAIKCHPTGTAAKYIIETAAVFEGYLLGAFVPGVSGYNLDGERVALCDVIRGLPDPNILDIRNGTFGGCTSSNRAHDVPDQSITASTLNTHSSSPHFSEPHPTDSSSEGRGESVADGDDDAPSGVCIEVNTGEVLSQIGAELLLSSLSQEELVSLQKRETPSDLAALLSGLASEEARRRRDA